jgi:hypothetical protein
MRRTNTFAGALPAPATFGRNFNRLKELNMPRNRLFNLLIVIALVIAIALTAQEAAATASMMSGTDSQKGIRSFECASLPSRYSIHTEYVQEMGVWVPYTEDGPTGVDGGLIYLLSNYRTCSQ